MQNALLGRKGLASVALILTAVILTYYNALFNGFVYDDLYIVLKNPLVRTLSNIPEVFLTGYWHSTGDSGGLYRPVTILSYLIEFAVAGEDPFLFHLDNIILHFLCCLLVYLVVDKVAANRTASAAAALLFAVHPVHAESVAWISGRSDLLSSFFTLAGLYVFISPPRRIPWYIASPGLMFLGLLAKETAIVLPVLVFAFILVFERGGRGRSVKGVVLAMAPYAAVTGLFLLVRFSILGSEVYPQDTGQVLVFTKGYWRALVMFRVFLEYMRNSIWPTDLQIHYMLRPPDSILSASSLLFLGIMTSLAAISPWLVRRRPPYFFFIAWFFIALLPVSNIIPIGILMADRVMYLPSVAVCALAGLLASWAGGIDTPTQKPGMRAVAAGLALATVAVVFGYLTHQRNPVWHDSRSIDVARVEAFKRVIEEFPESGLYYVNLSEAYTGLDMQEEALAALEKAVAVEPGNDLAHMELAETYRNMGMFGPALREAQASLSINPDLSEMSIKPVTYALVAEIFYHNGMKDRAEYYVNKSLSYDLGRDHEAYGTIAVYFYTMGMVDKAESYLRRAIELDPLIGRYHLLYGYLLSDKGNEEDALREFRTVSQVQPDMAEAYFEQGLILGGRDECAESASALENAVRLMPASPEYHYFLAAAYHCAGKDAEAATELKEALRLRPDYPEASRLLEILK